MVSSILEIQTGLCKTTNHTGGSLTFFHIEPQGLRMNQKYQEGSNVKDKTHLVQESFKLSKSNLILFNYADSFILGLICFRNV